MNKVYFIYLYVALGFITLLVILTKSQPVLVRKKLLLGLLILSLTAPAPIFVSCRTHDTKAVEQKDVWQSAGWVDGDTYRVRVMGTPQSTVKTDSQKKATARISAILMAESTAMEKIRPCMIESCGGLNPYTVRWDAFEKELNVIVKSGYVIAERYDANFNSEIIFEVKSPGIRKRVELLGNCK